MLGAAALGLLAVVAVLPTMAQNIGDVTESAGALPETETATLADGTGPATAADGGSGQEDVVSGDAVGNAAASAIVPDQEDVTVQDVENAGFTRVKEVAEEADRYLRPVYYFRVNETVLAGYPAWGEAADLVAVTVIEAKGNPALLSAPRAIQYGELFGRFQAKFTKAGRYVVVTGPDAQKVANLAKVIEAKEFED